jgi:hypothetical protein
MPPTCSICKHTQRAAIESQLVQGASLRDIAGRFATTRSALHRHKTHVFEKLTLAKTHQEALSAENLLHEMASLKSRLLRGLDQAERANSAAGFVSFAREVRMCLESYFSIADRLAERKLVQASANGGGLAQRIEAARKRRAEAREQAEDECQDVTSLELIGPRPV